eukprot:jgi/Phyca11/116630/e_gw1.31.566.1
MSDGILPDTTTLEADVKAIRDACISRDTRKKYAGNIKVIKKWIRQELAKVHPGTARYFNTSGDLDLVQFTPFEQFLSYKRVRAQSKPTRACYSWGGKFHKLPKNFELPSIDPLGAWQLWWFGDDRREDPPYRTISSADLDTPKKKATLSEWSIFMKHIINGIAAEVDAPIPTIRDQAHSIELFNIGFNTLKLKPSKRTRRSTQIKLTTVLRLIREADNSKRTLPYKAHNRSKAACDCDSEASSARYTVSAEKQTQMLVIR